MYKIDDEFRPRGRVFMKATRESTTAEQQLQRNVVPVPVRKSSLKKGPAITTNLDDRSIQFQHEVTHEKSVEALITEFPPHAGRHQRVTSPNRGVAGSSSTTGTVTRFHSDRGGFDVPDGVQSTSTVQSLQEITRNKRMATEILGSSYESKKLSQRAADGHRRITTHVVRKVTTLSRAEENAHARNMIQSAHNRTTEFGYVTTQALEAAPRKVHETHGAHEECVCVCVGRTPRSMSVRAIET